MQITDNKHILRWGSKDGVTLVEVMITAMLLSVMAIGSGAYIYHARAAMHAGHSQRLSLEAAYSRMEQIRASEYSEIRPPSMVTNLYYLSWNGANWVHQVNDPGEVADTFRIPISMETRVQYRDANGGTQTWDFVYVSVNTWPGTNRQNAVTLETYRAF